MWGFLHPIAAGEKLEYAGVAEGGYGLLEEVSGRLLQLS